MTQYFAKGAGKVKPVAPMTQAQLLKLGKHNMISVRPGKAHGVSMPAALCNSASRQIALQEVLDVRTLTTNETFARTFMESYFPEVWGEFPKQIPAALAAEGLSFEKPTGLANVVHMDLPTALGDAMLRWLISEGATPKKYNEKSKGFDFTAYVPDAIAGYSKAAAQGLDKAFDVKYWFLLPRPEEIDGSGGKEMTFYPEGSPNHPTFPAGHGFAAFAILRWFLKNWNVTWEQAKALFACAFIWAMARTLAGVHFAVDNLVHAPQPWDFEYADAA